jgi:hypothetical protein
MLNDCTLIFGAGINPKTRDAIHLHNGCRMVLSYFWSRHSKGMHDGVGAILKQEIKK